MAVNRMWIRFHFLQCHVRDTVVILEEGNLHHPQCHYFDILVPWADLNSLHPNTAQCSKGVERKKCRLEAEEIWDSTDRSC